MLRVYPVNLLISHEASTTQLVSYCLSKIILGNSEIYTVKLKIGSLLICVYYGKPRLKAKAEFIEVENHLHEPNL